MKRGAFLKRMAFALSATVFLNEMPRLHAEPAKLFPVKEGWATDRELRQMTDLSGLIHEIFVSEVVPAVRWDSPTAQMFADTSRGNFAFDTAGL